MTRYIIADADAAKGSGWLHYFEEEGRFVERETRFAFDRDFGRLAQLDIRRGPKWQAATTDEIANLEDSLVEANPEALVEPEAWGLTVSDELPDWALEADQSPAPL